MLSGIAGFFSSRSSISRRARSDTWLATLRNRFSTYSRSSSLTGVLRPLTSICMETLSSVDEAFTEGTPRSDLSQRSSVVLRRSAGHGFYSLKNGGAGQKIPEDAGDFRLLSARAVAALRQLPERNRFFKGLASWIGFRQIRVDYEPAPRTHGVTTFSAARLLGLSIEGITSFSVAPLRFASLLGVILAGGAFLFGLSILGGGLH